MEKGKKLNINDQKSSKGGKTSTGTFVPGHYAQENGKEVWVPAHYS